MSTLFQTWLNHQEEGADLEINNDPSETQPDMVMSLEELLIRSRGGQEVPTYNVQYDEDEDDFTPDPRTLDLVDYDEALEQNKANIETLKEQMKPKASSPKQQSDVGAISEAEGSQADKSASDKK